MTIDDLIENFEFLDSWEDKYRYIIELGEQLPPFDEQLKIEEWKVKGCQSQVWLVPKKISDGTIKFMGNSDAMIVKGLIFIVLSIYDTLKPEDILKIDIEKIFERLGLKEHLSPSRRNGLESLIEKIRRYAEIFETQGEKE